MRTLRALYKWVLHWADTPYGPSALFLLAFAESSFFPIPPDVLLIVLAISIPLRAFRYAAICSVGSVAGGVFGYFIGAKLMEAVGRPILEFYNVTEKYNELQAIYQAHGAWAVGIAAFTPIPYKAFTISAGAFAISLPVFVAASVVGRSARFFLVAALIYKFGEPVREFIERYFDLLALLFAALLVGGFILVKMVL